MSMIKGSKREMAISGAAYLVLGALMCAWPVGTAGVLCVMAGLALFAGGVWRAVGYFRKKDCTLQDRADFSAAALLIMFGAVLAVKREVFIVLAPFILGVMILASSVFQIQTAAELKKMKYDRWWYHLAAALVCGSAAVVMMFDPFGSYRVMAAVLGAAFVVDGAAQLWTALYLVRKLKRLGLME